MYAPYLNLALEDAVHRIAVGLAFVLCFSCCFSFVGCTRSIPDEVVLSHRVVNQEKRVLPDGTGMFVTILVTAPREQVNKETLEKLLRHVLSEVARSPGARYKEMGVYAFLHEEELSWWGDGQVGNALADARIEKDESNPLPEVRFLRERRIAESGKPPEDRLGMPEKKRREIFTAICAGRIAAENEDDERCPPPLGSKNKGCKGLIDRLEDKEALAVRKRYNLTPAQYEAIREEGYQREWPIPYNLSRQ
jgi:hypothetical protein